MGPGPQNFPLGGMPTPNSAKFRTFAQRDCGGWIFWKFSSLRFGVTGPKWECAPWKTGKWWWWWYWCGSCAILSTNGAKSEDGGLFFDICPQLARGCLQSWPKFTSCFGRFCDSRSAPFGLPPLGLPPPDSDHAKCVVYKKTNYFHCNPCLSFQRWRHSYFTLITITSLTQLKKITKTMILNMCTSSILQTTSQTRSSSMLVRRHSFIDSRNPRSFQPRHTANIRFNHLCDGFVNTVNCMSDLTAEGSTWPPAD